MPRNGSTSLVFLCKFTRSRFNLQVRDSEEPTNGENRIPIAITSTATIAANRNLQLASRISQVGHYLSSFLSDLL